MPSLYGTVRSTASDFAAVAASGGSFTTGGTIYLSLVARTRAGVNQPQTPISIAYSAGQKITCTIGEDAMEPGESGSIHEFWILGSATNDATTLKRLAIVRMLDDDQVTVADLPQTIELTRDAHLGLGVTVANTAALPTGSDRLDGMVRGITSPAGYVIWDGAESEWVSWLGLSGASNPFSGYVASVSGAGGCDRPIQSVVAQDSINPPLYTPGSGNSTPIRQCYLNGVEGDGGQVIESGSAIGVVLTIDGVSRASEFSKKLYAKYKGLFRKADGTLNTSNAAVGVSQAVTLSATSTGTIQTSLAFPEQVDRGYGALFEFWANIAPGDIQGVDEATSSSFYFYYQGNAGVYDPAASALGDAIVPAAFANEGLEIIPDGFCRVTPLFASVQSANGAGSIKSYRFSRTSVRTATGLVADTAGQKVAISGNDGGLIRIRQPAQALQSLEAQRALISTTSGTYLGSGWSSSVAVGAGGSIAVSVAYPSAVRSNYPDVIAGTTAYFNVPKLRVFVRKGGSSIYEVATPITAVSGSSQDFLVTTIPVSTTTLPVAPSDPGFCLFGYPVAPTIAASVSGSLTADNYEVQIYYHFPSPNLAVSKISHSVGDGCIPEQSSTLASAIAGAKGYTDTTASFTQPATGATVTVSVGNSDFVAIGQTVFVQSGGYYEVTARPSSNQLTLENLGYDGNAAPTTTVPTSSRLTLAGTIGSIGLPGFGLRYTFDSATTASGISNGELRLNNGTISSATVMYVSETERSGGNAASALSTIANGTIIQLSKESDATVYARFTLNSQTDSGSYRTISLTYLGGNDSFSDGDAISLQYALRGAAGVSSKATTADDFTQPAVNSTVTVELVEGTEARVVDEYVYITDGTSEGWYRITAIANPNITIQNLGYSGSLAPSSDMLAGAIVVPSGARGGVGATGLNAYTVTTANFTQPAVNSTVVASVTAGTGDARAVGEIVYVSDGTDFGWYQITAKASDSVTLKNLGYSGSAAPGATINFPATVNPSGTIGGTGLTGTKGEPGGGIRYTFSSTTTATPSSGQLRFNNSTIASVTSIYVHETDRLSSSIAGLLDIITNGSALYIVNDSRTGFATFTLTSQTDNGSDRTLAVTYVGTSGSFVDTDNIVFDFSPKGATGGTGADGVSGFGVRYTFSTTTTTPPGTGQLRFDNATIASVTNIYIHETDRNSVGVAGILDAITAGARILVASDNTPTTYAHFSVTSITDNGTDRTIAVTYIANNGTFSNSSNVSLQFAIKGDAGTVAATTSLVLNQVATDQTTAASTIGVYNLNGAVRWRLASNGTVQIPLIAGLQTTFVPAVAMRSRQDNGATAITTAATTTGRPDTAGFDFDGGTAKYLQFEVDFPKAWNRGTITAQFVWRSTTSGTGTVIWGIQGVAQSDNDAIDVAYGTAVTVSDTFLSTTVRHTSPTSGNITIAGTPAVGDSCCFQVYRDAATDTKTDNAILLGVRIFFTTNASTDV